MPEGIRVECVEYVAGIRNIASIGMMQLVQEAKFEPPIIVGAKDKLEELRLSSEFRPRPGRQIVEIPIPSPHDSTGMDDSIEPVPFCVSLSARGNCHRRMFS